MNCENVLPFTRPRTGTVINLRCKRDWGHTGTHRCGRQQWPSDTPWTQPNLTGVDAMLADADAPAQRCEELRAHPGHVWEERTPIGDTHRRCPGRSG
jgi:hypothetical protein